MNPVQRNAYLRTQLIANFLINLVINGLIAFFFYRARPSVPLVEVAVDLQITLTIIGFLVTWLAILNTRKYLRGRKAAPAWLPGIRLPESAALRALVIMLLIMVGFGGLLTAGFALTSPNGIVGWGYVILKALYTGGAAVLAAWLAILSVIQEMTPKNEEF